MVTVGVRVVVGVGPVGVTVGVKVGIKVRVTVDVGAPVRVMVGTGVAVDVGIPGVGERVSSDSRVATVSDNGAGTMTSCSACWINSASAWRLGRRTWARA